MGSPVANLMVAILLLPALMGCASVGGFPKRPEIIPSKSPSQASRTEADVLREYEKSGSSQKKQFRNDAVFSRMLAIDRQYGLFKRALYKQTSKSKLSFDLLEVTVGTLGTVFTNATTSRVFSALSGGIASTAASVDKNLYYEQTLPALFSVMDAEREKVRVEILRGLGKEPQEYSLVRALVDLERLLHVGSIPGAILAVQRAAGATNAAAEKERHILTR